MSDEFLNQYANKVVETAKLFCGYPANQSLDSNMAGFYEWLRESGVLYLSLDNAGNPFNEPGPSSSHEVEKKVIEMYAPLYGINKEEVWGFVTSSGSSGNNHGIYFGRKYLHTKVPDQEPVVYVSKESHYSNMRLCDLQQLELCLIDTDEMGRMQPEALRKALNPQRPVLMIYSMGSTFMGAIDDQQALNQVLDEMNPVAVYRHVDAALFGGYLPFTEHKDLVNQKLCRYNSISVSGHKFYGTDVPCGLFLTTQEVVEAQTQFHPEYINSTMFMIDCSRSTLDPLKFYWMFTHLGVEEFSKQAQAILKNAAYLKAELDCIGWPAWKNELSNTVFFRRPSEAVIKKYSLARGYVKAYGDLAHVVVMQHVTPMVIDRLVADLQAEK